MQYLRVLGTAPQFYQSTELFSKENKENADVIYVNLGKAFDNCDNGVIAHKMPKMVITGKVVKIGIQRNSHNTLL